MVPASPSTGAAAVRTAVARAAAPAAPVDQALPTRRVAMDGSHKFLQDLVISGAAAAFSKTVNSPLEVTKLIMQTQPHRFPGGVRELVVQLPKQEGVLAFWQGNATNVLRYFPSQALTFALKGVCEDVLSPGGASVESESSKFVTQLVSGGVAGGLAMLASYPLDLARTRLSTDAKHAAGASRQYRNMRHCLAVTYRQGGVRGLYRGLGVSLIGTIPYRAVYFGGYSTMMNALRNEDSGFGLKMGVAWANTVAAQMLTYPADTVRRVQMKAGELQPGGVVTRTYAGAWDCFRHLLKTTGVRGLYRGSLVNTFRATGAALCMALYDTAQELLQQQE